MIKLIDRTTIQYIEDTLPYIEIVGLPAQTIAVLEIEEKTNQRKHYLLSDSKQVNPETSFNINEPKACLIFITSATTFVRSNIIAITDWKKFVLATASSPTIKIAQLESRIRNLEAREEVLRQYEGDPSIGSVLTMCEGNKPLFKLPYSFSVQTINGKRPNKDGVIELKISDFRDFVMFANSIISIVKKLNERVALSENEILELNNPVL